MLVYLSTCSVVLSAFLSTEKTHIKLFEDTNLGIECSANVNFNFLSFAGTLELSRVLKMTLLLSHPRPVY